MLLVSLLHNALGRLMANAKRALADGAHFVRKHLAR